MRWSDKDVKQTFQSYDIPVALVMRDEYEKALAECNEDSGNLRNELSKALAHLAELEAQLDAAVTRLNAKSERIVELEAQLQAAQYQAALKWPGVWHPINEDEIKCDCSDQECVNVIEVEDGGLFVTLRDGDTFVTVALPDDIRLCRKVQAT